MGKIGRAGKREKKVGSKKEKGKRNRKALLASLRPAPRGVLCADTGRYIDRPQAFLH